MATVYSSYYIATIWLLDSAVEYSAAIFGYIPQWYATTPGVPVHRTVPHDIPALRQQYYSFSFIITPQR